MCRAGVRSRWSSRRQRLIQDRVRSTTQRRGRTSNVALPLGLLARSAPSISQALPGDGDQPPGVAAVGPHQRDRGEPFPQQRHQAVPAVAVLHAGRGDQHHQQQSRLSTATCRLRPLIFFPPSNPRRGRPTVSAPLTDWESITAAAIGSRPSAIADRVPQRVEHPVGDALGAPRSKYQYTVSHGGKSCGSGATRTRSGSRTRSRPRSGVGWSAGRPPGGPPPSARSAPTAHRSGRTDNGLRAHRPRPPHWPHQSHQSRRRAEHFPNTF